MGKQLLTAKAEDSSWTKGRRREHHFIDECADGGLEDARFSVVPWYSRPIKFRPEEACCSVGILASFSDCPESMKCGVTD